MQRMDYDGEITILILSFVILLPIFYFNLNILLKSKQNRIFAMKYE